MFPTRINVTLSPTEMDALTRLARREIRDPRAQAAILIRRQLLREGVLTGAEPPDAPAAHGWGADL